MKTQSIAKILAVVSFLGVVLSAEVSSGQTYTVWNTFQEPGDNYYTFGGPTINGTNAFSTHSYQAVADAFTPSASGYLYTISLAAAVDPGSPGINVYLAANNNNHPGAVLESFLNVSPPTLTGNYNTPITLSPIGALVLSKGVTYWLYVEPNDPNTEGVWNYAINNPSGSYMMEYELTPGVWGTANHTTQAEAFEITLVPEPSSWALMIGGLGLGAIWKRRSRAMRAAKLGIYF